MKQVTVFYKRSVDWHCPHCGQHYNQPVDNPANLAEVPQVGETLTCFACKQSYLIGSEELS